MQILYENQLIPKSLENDIKEHKELQPFFEYSFSGMKPKNYCGFLTIGGENYFIAPKITTDETKNLNTFLYMLIYAYNIDLSNIELSNFETGAHTIFELFIQFFSNTLRDECKKGLFKEYVTYNDTLKVLRGKYVIEKNFTNFYHQNIGCEFDEFSADNTLNQFFLYALKVFKRYSRYRSLYQCEMLFDEVCYRHIDITKQPIVFDRTNSRFYKSYEMAQILLQKLTPLTGKAQQTSFAFLFDMGEVFEKFVGRLYKEVDRSVKLQQQRTFGSLQLKPDIVRKDQIIDTKYKVLNTKKELQTSDKYQMFAYGKNFNIKQTLLLYPKHMVDVEEDMELGRGAGSVYLKLKSLDLQGSEDYPSYIESMKYRIGVINARKN